MLDCKGLVFDIQRFSLFDGPGIRTTVFFKGCPLHCPWCHNPEGILPRPELMAYPARCIGCGACVKACPHGAHRVDDHGVHTLDRAACVMCGACAKACPADALELCGKTMSVGEVMAVVRRDHGFYTDSGGGLTLSGGEPLMQPVFAKALLEAARAEGLQTAVETSGCAPWARFDPIVPLTDLFLFDIKETDPVRHEQWTGMPLKPILDNLRRLAAAGCRIVLRLPLAPGFNDRPDHFEGVAKVARELPNLEGADLLPYHRMGEGKPAALGRGDVAPPCREPDPELIHQWKEQFARAGLVVRLAEKEE
jgi:pyruvate formate lyase activating enzyme